MQETPFDLDQFLPYLLTQAAEATGAAFQSSYRRDHGLTRTEWRVLAQLGKHGSLTAAQICRATFTEKTKVSRAVQALAGRDLLQRLDAPADRRSARLTLTAAGQAAFLALGIKAIEFNQSLRHALGPEAAQCLATALARLITLAANPPGQPAP